jgi:hypothetical protein
MRQDGVPSELIRSRLTTIWCKRAAAANVLLAVAVVFSLELLAVVVEAQVSNEAFAHDVAESVF